MNHPHPGLPPPRGAFLGAEWLLATCLVVGVCYLAVPLGQQSADKAQFAELMMHAPLARRELAVEYAVTGRWPDQLPSLQPGGVIGEQHQLDHANGSLVIAFDSPERPEGRLAFERLDGEHATLIWRCGYGEPPSGSVVPAPYPTSIRPELLPAACRYLVRP